MSSDVKWQPSHMCSSIRLKQEKWDKELKAFLHTQGMGNS